MIILAQLTCGSVSRPASVTDWQLLFNIIASSFRTVCIRSVLQYSPGEHNIKSGWIVPVEQTVRNVKVSADAPSGEHMLFKCFKSVVAEVNYQSIV